VKRLTTLEAGAVPASDLSSLFREHGAMIAALPQDVPDPVDDDDDDDTEPDDDTTIDWRRRWLRMS